jgi:twinkle protein
VVSVPNGFNLKGELNLDYIDNYNYFESKETIFIAVDNDEAGKDKKKELIRRFGAEKCKIIDFRVVKMLMII